MATKNNQPLSYRWLLALLIVFIPIGTLAAQPEPSEDTQFSKTIFEFLLKGGIRYHHATGEGSALYNFRLPLELELLFEIAPQLHLGIMLGVELGLASADTPLPLLASNNFIANLPVYAALRYRFTPSIALQPYSGAIFNLTGYEPLYHFTVGAQLIFGLLLLDVGYILNISALSARGALLPHSFRAGIMAVIPIVLLPLEPLE